MVTNLIKIFSVFIVLLTLTATTCDPCVANPEPEVTQPNLIIISPFQDTYSVGDELTVSMILASEQDFDFPRETIDIYQKTNIEEAKMQNVQLHKIFESNPFTILEGNYEGYIPTIHYYSQENEYRFKARVNLNKLGSYSFYAEAEIYFKDLNDDCISYGINTNVEGMNENGKIEFIVE